MPERFTFYDAAKYLREKLDVRINASGLIALWQQGRGPKVSNLRAGPRYDPKDLDRWANYYVGVDRPFDYVNDSYEAMRDTFDPRPRWLVVHEHSPDADYMRDQLTAFGCGVAGPIESARQALESASDSDIDAAIISMDWNIEAAIVIADMLIERKIPFLFITTFREVPSNILLGGTVLRVPCSFEDVPSAIRRRSCKEPSTPFL